MKHHKTNQHRRGKLILSIGGALALGAGLIALSAWIRPAASAPAATGAPASAPASAPAAPAAPIDPKAASANNLSGMILLLGLSSLLAAVGLTVMLIVQIRNSRPAWQTQQRYPKRR